MANICNNFLTITKYNLIKEDEILEFLSESNKETLFSILKTNMPDFRIYEDDNLKHGVLNSQAHEISLSFDSAWGGNASGIAALSAQPLFSDALVIYRNEIEGDATPNKYFLKNGTLVNSKGEDPASSRPSKLDVSEVKKTLKKVDTLFKKASSLNELLYEENDIEYDELCSYFDVETNFDAFKETIDKWEHGLILTLADLSSTEDNDYVVDKQYFTNELSDFEVQLKEIIASQKEAKKEAGDDLE